MKTFLGILLGCLCLWGGFEIIKNTLEQDDLQEKEKEKNRFYSSMMNEGLDPDKLRELIARPQKVQP